jgi:hypothetical protein
MASATAGDLLIEEFVAGLARRFIGPGWGARRIASLQGCMQVAFFQGQQGRPCWNDGEFGPALQAAHEAGRRFGADLYAAGLLWDAASKAHGAADALPRDNPLRPLAMQHAESLGVLAGNAAAAARAGAQALDLAPVEG